MEERKGALLWSTYLPKLPWPSSSPSSRSSNGPTRVFQIAAPRALGCSKEGLGGGCLGQRPWDSTLDPPDPPAAPEPESGAAGGSTSTSPKDLQLEWSVPLPWAASRWRHRRRMTSSAAPATTANAAMPENTPMSSHSQAGVLPLDGSEGGEAGGRDAAFVSSEGCRQLMMKSMYV